MNRNKSMTIEEDLRERITVIVHDALSPLLTDALGMEHGWDAAEGVADALMDSGALPRPGRTSAETEAES